MSEGPTPVSAGERGFVYLAQAGADGIVKVGSAVDVDARLTDLRVRNPDLVLRRVFPGGRKWERQLHYALEPWRLEGEWFKPTPEVVGVFELAEDEFRPWILEQKSRVAGQRDRALVRRSWGTTSFSSSRIQHLS